MFKKGLHIALTILLLTTTSGFSIFNHLCGEELINMSLFEKEKHCCSDSGDMPTGCCHNEQVKVSDKQEFISLSFDWQAAPTFVTGFQFILALPHFGFDHQFESKHLEPSITKNKDHHIYILIQSFLI